MLERARRDIEDIGVLRKTEAFSRYWLRRLKQKRDDTEKSFKFAPVAECTPARREELRQLLLVFEELLGMMEADDSAARTTYGDGQV